jgi:O-antigen/teichoic acid export membrane protein
MKRHLYNAASGLLDYAAYPLGMIVVAPVLLRGLGPSPFGIWAFTMAVINTGAILASGFGDANIQQVAVARSTDDTARVESCIRTTLSIHLFLGGLLALTAYSVAPLIATHLASAGQEFHLCTVSLQIGSICILLRALETVVVSTQRAFERYSESVRISTTTRVLSLFVSAALALKSASVPKIVLATTILLALGTLAQFARLAGLVSSRCLIPGCERATARAILRLGAFTWLQATGTAVFGQIDRLFVGMSFGAVAVGAYSLCMQIAQPIAGTAASAFHFIFPLLARTSSGPDPRIARPIAVTFCCNLLFVTIASTVLLIFGAHFLRAWTAPVVANQGIAILPFAIIASSLVGLSVTGVYAMLALGRAAAVVCTTVLGGVLMLGGLNLLPHRYGIQGVVTSRLLFGLSSLAIYLPLTAVLRNTTGSKEMHALSLSSAGEGV